LCRRESEAGAHRDSELLIFVEPSPGEVSVQPEAGTNRDAQSNGTHGIARPNQAPSHTRTDGEALAEHGLPPERTHPTKAARKVDPVQVEVYSKGQAIDRQHRKAQSHLPGQGRRIARNFTK
jgi:hypothetical protein